MAKTASHWKETVYNNELLTGYIESAGIPMPISLFTVRSLQDLGYEVDTSQADPFPPPSGRRRLRGQNKVHLDHDILKFDVKEMQDISPKKGQEERFQEEKLAWETRKKKLEEEDA